MERYRKKVIIHLFLIIGIVPVSYAENYIEGEILVRFSDIVPQPEVMQILSNQQYAPLETMKIVPNLQLIKLPQGKRVEEAIQEFEKEPYVLYASPNYIIDIGGGILPPPDQPGQPDKDPRFSDPFFYRSYGIRLIRARDAWSDFTLGNREVIVGVIDTGIDYHHEDLSENMWKNIREIEKNGIDDDQNGYVDDVYGWNFVDGNNDPFDDNHHGTHVAGTIGAVNGNQLGTIGVSPKVSLMACKFLNNQGRGSLVGAIKCIEYAVTNGAKVLNNSWGGPGYSNALLDAIKAAEKLGVLFVAAAGNATEDVDKNPMYPACFDAKNIIAVAATDRNDLLTNFSNFGKNSVDLAAPGSFIYSTLPNNQYGNMDGTSMATPHVSGAAALLWAFKPTLSLYDLKELILKTADPVDSLKNITVTGGRLNVYNAMALSLFSF